MTFLEGYPDLGKHPATGEEYTSISLHVEGHDEIIHRLFAPSPPKETAGDPYVLDYETDDDGEEWPVYRDEPWGQTEVDAAFAAYEKAKAEWDRSGGTGAFLVSGGPPTVTALCETAGGATAELVLAEDRWIVLGWSTMNR